MKIAQLSQIGRIAVSHDPQLEKKLLIEKGVVPHFTGYSYVEVPVDGYVSAHHHEDMWEMFFVSSGRAVMSIDDEVFEISKGSCIVVEPKEVHTIKNVGKTKLIMQYFGITK